MSIVKFSLDCLPKIKVQGLCIGKFDGFHKGHVHIINYTKALAKTDNVAILTFSPLPFIFFKKGNKVIYTDNEKLQIANTLGIYYMLILHFNEILSKTSGEQFLAKISQITSNIVVGKGFKFGINQSCNEDDLLQMQSRYGYKAHILENIMGNEDNKISSMALRQCILAGDFEQYTKISYIPFFVIGTVQKGMQLAGKSIGFPTINLHLSSEKIMPRYGVYSTKITLGNITYPSISNYGIKPTIGTTEEPILETHILNYNGDLYGEDIKVEFIKQIRTEQKFTDINQLKFQIAKDIETCKAIHGL